MPFSLLHPALFALGIACVSIPIILHLLKRKRRPISWGAMRFLEQAYRKRRRILTIEQLILLALRCLLMILLALGVGSLMLGSGSMKTIPTIMVIVIDDSIGSATSTGDSSDSNGPSTLLDEHKQLALRAIDELDASHGDQVVLIASGAPARGLVTPMSTDLSAVRELIDELEPTDSMIDLAGTRSIINSMSLESQKDSRGVLVFASAGLGIEDAAPGNGTVGGSDSSTQQNHSRFDQVLALEPSSVQLLNVGISSASSTRSLVTQSDAILPMGIRVELIRTLGGSANATQDQSSQTSIRVFTQTNQLIGQGSVRWEQGQQQVTAVVAIDPVRIQTLSAKTALLRLQIDEDANNRDNTHLIAVQTRSTIRVGVIDQSDTPHVEDPSGFRSIAPSRWVRAALAPSDERFGISIVDIEASRAGSMLTPDLDALIVLSPSAIDRSAWERIGSLNETGTLVLITPDRGSGSLSWIDSFDSMTDQAGMIGNTIGSFDLPIRLGDRITSDHTGLLFGLSSEYPNLARSVSVYQNLPLNSNTAGPSGMKPLIELQDGSSLAGVVSSDDSRGTLVVFGSAFDLEWTDLPARPMFVPMLQEIVRQGVGYGFSSPTVISGSTIPSPLWAASSHRVLIDQNSTAPGSRAIDSLDANESARAGLIAMLDAQGSTRGYVLINPDARGSKGTPSSKSILSEHLSAHTETGEIDWVPKSLTGSVDSESGPGSPGTQSAHTLLPSSSPSVSIALWMLLAAGIIAAIEAVLAKLFTAKLYDDQVVINTRSASKGVLS